MLYQLFQKKSIVKQTFCNLQLPEKNYSNIFFTCKTFFSHYDFKLFEVIAAVRVPNLSEDKRSKWEIKDGTTLTQIRFNLPTDFADLFPPENGEIEFYQIYVLGNSSNEEFRKGKPAWLHDRIVD